MKDFFIMILFILCGGSFIAWVCTIIILIYYDRCDYIEKYIDMNDKMLQCLIFYLFSMWVLCLANA